MGSNLHNSLRLVLVLLIAPLLGAGAASAGEAPAAAAPDAHVSPLTAEQLVQILDQTVDWYRTLGIQQQNATQPSDLLLL